MKLLTYALAGLFLFMISSCSNQSEWTLKSPDENIVVQIENQGTEEGQKKLIYTVNRKSANAYMQVIEPSTLGLIRSDADFTNLEFLVAHTEPNIVDSYEMLIGKRLQNSDTCNQLTLQFKSNTSELINIIFRVYNEGIAFKYHMPGNTSDSLEILEEKSMFNLPDEGQAWLQPYDSMNTWSPAYEFGYPENVRIGDIPPKHPTTGWALPGMFHANDFWYYITETSVGPDYCGSHLASNCKNGEYKVEFAHDWEAFGLFSSKPKNSLPWETPWRILMVSDNPGDIIESNIMHTLARPAQIEKSDWMMPGISSWSWWSDHVSGKNFEKLKEYVDFSARMGWRYSLVDADWHIMEGGSLQELAEYAENKGVKLWIWYNSGGPHTKVMNAGPRDLVYNKEIRRAEFKRISDMGIVGIKVDFFQSDKQQIIKLYHDIIKDAADFNIMVNTHGCTLPRGWFRTYPNLMTMEAVRGAELYGYPPFATEAVRLNTIYPFTRNVMGSMDYTPVTFSDYMEESAHRTTNAHELALSVIFESGVQHFADRYESYEAQPDFVVDFLKNVPVTWDDTYFVDGFPGKEVVMARKKQDTYFLAGINGEFKEKTLTFDLDFLPEGQFEMTLIKEGDTPRSFNTETMSIAGKDSFSIDIMPAGGFVAVIK